MTTEEWNGSPPKNTQQQARVTFFPPAREHQVLLFSLFKRKSRVSLPQPSSSLSLPSITPRKKKKINLCDAWVEIKSTTNRLEKPHICLPGYTQLTRLLATPDTMHQANDILGTLSAWLLRALRMNGVLESSLPFTMSETALDQE